MIPGLAIQGFISGAFVSSDVCQRSRHACSLMLNKPLISIISVGIFRVDSRFHTTPVVWNLGLTWEIPSAAYPFIPHYTLIYRDCKCPCYYPDFKLHQQCEIWDYNTGKFHGDPIFHTTEVVRNLALWH